MRLQSWLYSLEKITLQSINGRESSIRMGTCVYVLASCAVAAGRSVMRWSTGLSSISNFVSKS